MIKEIFVKFEYDDMLADKQDIENEIKNINIPGCSNAMFIENK